MDQHNMFKLVETDICVIGENNNAGYLLWILS